MSRSRMFDDDDPAANPSPRTTIVGGRPPEDRKDLPPVPTGLQRLLRLASVDGAFRAELVARRAAVADAAGVTLTASERSILAAVPAVELERMVGSLPPPPTDRRDFLRQTAATAAVLLGGAALEACDGHKAERPPERDFRPTAGVRPDQPPALPVDAAAPASASPDAPPPRPDHSFPAPGGAAPDYPPPPRPVHRETDTDGGASPHLPPPRPDHSITGATGGIAPDLPPPPAGGGATGGR